MTSFIFTCLAFIVFSWAFVCGVLKMVALCFALSFSLKWASAIWVALVVKYLLFSKKGDN